MREIKFRGKRIDTGEWVYGYYDVHQINHGIWTREGTEFPEWHQIEPESVGQLTGLKDKNGQESYESDACKVYIETGGISERKTGYMYGTIVFDKGEFLIIPYHYEGEITSVFGKDKIYGMLPYRISEKQFEIIGNIYTSPELLNPLNKQS